LPPALVEAHVLNVKAGYKASGKLDPKFGLALSGIAGVDEPGRDTVGYCRILNLDYIHAADVDEKTKPNNENAGDQQQTVQEEKPTEETDTATVYLWLYSCIKNCGLL